MTGYIEKSLHQFQHYSPFCKHNSPQQWIIPQYSARIKYAPDDDTTSELDKDAKQNSSILLEHCCNTIVL